MSKIERRGRHTNIQTEEQVSGALYIERDMVDALKG